ncbi:hypothetical protein SAMN02745119_01913 [Trichlorobacter thiogenes]|uniref:IPT/TIG domain-containing protein n=1 Tax=Trichlorobacter thiogenes TaxID=115783 RepID=A0A1T4PB52_9BACT|nr:IPT/TIG domain-containing protein [Trichlorobacter thiogenes]SJZ88780.1 hypothetical protein SAMN02745119_01913 [Trichlorobacter thiogenes]
MSRHLTRCTVVLAIFVTFCLQLANSRALADAPPIYPYAATASVSYSGSQPGRIYIQAQGGSGSNRPNLQNLGVSIAAPGSFTLRGLQPGTYYLRAFRDVSGTGIRHANDPVSASYTSSSSGLRVDIAANGTASYPGGTTLAISDPSLVSLERPTFVTTNPALRPVTDNNLTLLRWNVQTSLTTGLVVPTSYLIEWSTDGGGTITGSKTIPASDGGRWLHTTTSTYWYRITAQLSGSTQASDWVQAQNQSYIRSITGTVSYSGYDEDTSQEPLGTLYVAAIPLDPNLPPHITAITNPTANAQAFTIKDVADYASYRIYAFMDINRIPSGDDYISAPNGIDDAGDLRMADESVVTVTVNNNSPDAGTLPLRTGNAALSVATTHSLYGEPGATSSGENYGYILSIHPNLLAPINAQVIAGSRMDVPADLGLWYENGAYRLDLGNLLAVDTGDSYTVRVFYASGYNDLTVTATRAPLQSPPKPTTPLFGVAYPAVGEPTFNWMPPQAPGGASWLYNLQAYPLLTRSPLLEVQGLSIGSYSDPLHADGWSLTSANSFYLWNPEAQTSTGDTINYQAIFAAHPTAPVITGIWPASVAAGTILNISGFNLDSPTSVTIGSTELPVTASSATGITVTVPTPFNETNSYLYPVVTTASGSFTWGLYYGAPLGNGAVVETKGYVQDAAGTKLADALVAMVGNPLINDSTRDATKDLGYFSVERLPNNSVFSLRISKTGYQPTYTEQLTRTTTFTAPSPYPLLTYTQLNSLASGMIPGKAAVLLKVKNASEIPLAGAVVTVTSSSGTVYTPRYAVLPSNYTGTVGTTTEGNGMVLIPNVNHGDRLTIYADKAVWAFSTMIAIGATESLTYGEIYGGPQPPTITSFSPASAAEGAVVNIYGANFNPDNTTKVYFNGILQNERTVNNTSITTKVPAGAISGKITVTTAGGTATSATDFTVLVGLEVTFPGEGRGTITGSGGATFSCPASYDAKWCEDTFAPYDSTVTLSATPDAYSSFVQWSLRGTSTTSTNPTGFAVLMNGSKMVDANLALLALLQNVESETVYRNDEPNPVWRALFFATNAQPTIKAVSLGTIPLPDNGVTFNTGQSVKLLGGYSDFREATPGGYTYLTGPFTIVSGRLVLDRIVIK